MPDEPSSRRKKRGAATNPPPRFLPTHTVAFDDGWSADDEAPPPLRTTITPETCRTIISRNESPDLPFDQSVNPYRGCEHGCVYCYARPTHAYLDLSPGLDFESKLFSKPNAATLLSMELRKKNYRPRVIALGVNTDCYQPIERSEKTTRELLQVFLDYRHPVSIITKSSLILRDLDLLGKLAQSQLIRVQLSITTLDRQLARRMEPRAASPGRRLDVISQLARAGVPTGVFVAPVIPALTDGELESIISSAATAGATSADYTLVRLPLELKELFEDWLERQYPLKKEHVLSLIRQARGGQIYRSDFATRMRGTGDYANLLEERFQLACARHSLFKTPPALSTDYFCTPPEYSAQLTLF